MSYLYVIYIKSIGETYERKTYDVYLPKTRKIFLIWLPLVASFFFKSHNHIILYGWKNFVCLYTTFTYLSLFLDTQVPYLYTINSAAVDIEWKFLCECVVDLESFWYPGMIELEPLSSGVCFLHHCLSDWSKIKKNSQYCFYWQSSMASEGEHLF